MIEKKQWEMTNDERFEWIRTHNLRDMIINMHEEKEDKSQQESFEDGNNNKSP